MVNPLGPRVGPKEQTMAQRNFAGAGVVESILRLLPFLRTPLWVLLLVIGFIRMVFLDTLKGLIRSLRR